jgi:hypothetical protein
MDIFKMALTPAYALDLPRKQDGHEVADFVRSIQKAWEKLQD